VTFSTPYTNVNDTYYDSGGVRRDWLGALTLDVPIADWLDGSTTYYHHYDKGSGGIYTPAVFSPAGFPLSVRTTEYGIKRDGGLARATATLGGHTIQIGYWHEDNSASTDRNYYAASLTNRPDVTTFLTNPFRSDFLTDLTTVTNQYFVSDNWKILDALTIAGGFKAHASRTASRPPSERHSLTARSRPRTGSSRRSARPTASGTRSCSLTTPRICAPTSARSAARSAPRRSASRRSATR
jgi:hypothetical protein